MCWRVWLVCCRRITGFMRLLSVVWVMMCGLVAGMIACRGLCLMRFWILLMGFWSCIAYFSGRFQVRLSLRNLNHLAHNVQEQSHAIWRSSRLFRPRNGDLWIHDLHSSNTD